MIAFIQFDLVFIIPYA